MRPYNPGVAARLSKPSRLLIGILTVWPILYFIVFMVAFFVPFFLSAFSHPQTAPPVGLFFTFFALHLFTILLIYGLMALYIVDVFKNDRIASDRKALWAVVIFFGSIIAMPIYWYLYFWRDPLPPPPPPEYPPYPSYPPYPPPPTNP